MRHRQPIAATILLFFLFTSCRSSLPVRTFRVQEDAGTVQVAVQSVAPFDEDFINQLQPALPLPDIKSKTAITLARVQEVQHFRALLAEAGIALPTDTSAFTKELSADGTKTVTGTEERKPGDASTIPAAPTGISQTLTPFAPSEAQIAIDESLNSRATMALSQEVALLNRQVRDAAISRGTKPYVLRFLVTLNPTARREPYNSFASISLFAANGETELPSELEKALVKEAKTQQSLYGLLGKTTDLCGGTVEMVPLFVTDNLESSADTTALQSILNAGAGAAGLVQNITARIAARFQTNDQKRAKTTGFNALYTVGRVSTNTVEARLGAFISGLDFETVPRTYNVTVLALVPTLARVLDNKPDLVADRHERALVRSVANDVVACRQLAFTSAYRFTDGRTGKTLRSDFDRVATKELGQLKKTWRMEEVTVDELRNLMTYANIDDFESFRDALKSNATSPGATEMTSAAYKVNKELTPEAGETPGTSLRPNDNNALTQMFWLDLMNVARRSGRTYGRVSVPVASFTIFTHDNSATIVDDGEKTATVTLAGATDLTSTALEARLEVNGTHTFYAKSITVSRDGRRASLEFDSPHSLLNGDPTSAKLTITRSGGQRAFQSAIGQQYVASLTGDGVVAARLSYITKTKKEEAKADPAPAVMNVTSDHILLAADGQSGSIAVAFAPTDTEKDPPNIRLSVKGADIVGILPTMAPKGLDFVGAANGTYVMQLRNIAVNEIVTIVAFADKKGARGTEIGKQTVRVVDFQRPAPTRVSRGE